MLARPASAAAPVLGLSGRTVSPRGHITVTFRLARPATVVFAITRTTPVRRNVGAFAVRGHVGANRFLFPGRLERRRLRPGTHRLAATIEGARTVSPTFAVVPATSAQAQAPRTESPTHRKLVVLFVLLAIPLLAVAALPGRAVPVPRGAELLAAGRPALVVAGFAALAAACTLYIANAL